MIHFKSLQATLFWLGQNASSLDLVVCDHNILLFENDPKTPAQAMDIYFELRMGLEKVPFIHFSADPCSEKYQSENDPNFYSLQKDPDTNLMQYVKNIFSNKKD